MGFVFPAILLIGLGILLSAKGDAFVASPPSPRGQDIRPLLKELGFSSTISPVFWQKDLGRRRLELEIELETWRGDSSRVLTVGLETRTPGALGVGPNHPADHANVRIPFKEGSIVCSGASKAAALRLCRIELEGLVQQLGAPFVQGEIPPFQLRGGWLRWTVPGKLTVRIGPIRALILTHRI